MVFIPYRSSRTLYMHKFTHPLSPSFSSYFHRLESQQGCVQCQDRVVPEEVKSALGVCTVFLLKKTVQWATSKEWKIFCCWTRIHVFSYYSSVSCLSRTPLIHAFHTCSSSFTSQTWNLKEFVLKLSSCCIHQYIAHYSGKKHSAV